MLTKTVQKELPLLIMIMPAVILVFIFSYIPLAGTVIAFQRFVPAFGVFHSKWVGLANFQDLFNLPDFYQVLWNTVFISFMKIFFELVTAVVFALLLNEVSINPFKRTFQTIVYLPYFLSWVIMGGIFVDILSPGSGVVNLALNALGIKSIFFLGSDKWFPFALITTNTWKEFGFGTIIYLAALTNIDPTLYEASIIDGANRWKQTLHVTIPGIMPIVVLMAVLSMGNILNAGFDQVFNLYSPIVYKSGDILDTLVYRTGMVDARYSLATAAGFFKSVISFIIVAVSFKLADKVANYRVF